MVNDAVFVCSVREYLIDDMLIGTYRELVAAKLGIALAYMSTLLMTIWVIYQGFMIISGANRQPILGLAFKTGKMVLILSLVALVAGVAALFPRRGVALGASGLVVLIAGFGAFVAARQSWLQWNPPEIMTCGRDFFGMIEAFPLRRAIPMIFRGTGDCSVIDWTFLGLSIANWSFLCFSAIAVVAVALWVKRPAA